MLRIAVIGLGVISRFYLRAAAGNSGIRLTAVCDRQPEKRALAPAGTFFTTDYREVLDHDEVDAVIITLPNDLHYEVCRKALLAGKHVCCEKPLTTNPGEALELAAIAAGGERVLFTSFHRRYNANVVALRERLRTEPTPSAFRLTYRELIEEHCGDDTWYLDPERCGGGCVMDNGPNAFDTLLFLLGDVVVRSSEIERDAAGVDLRAVIGLETAQGARGVVELDWAHPGEDKAVTVEWSGGRSATADMLAGFTEFKSSLHHEYEALLAEFERTVAGAREREDTGPKVARLVADAYRLG
ncbi:Gfo/Idh/MocA family oxidoreductase [Lentzea sp.]|uniref:Gfo/Idh/MocA family protein n=1 Tax=Lentzea sp. TaxID=56099 RepID=UPI002BB9BD96|nr:Gfo/Idh/MocA family oxidoreductase [Lentzea sp.]HUQ56462.1 Gfo/Idh/MocA family oxidoreductase [Lentzea sp.]